MRRCGYIALMGRPNAGKSTLLNALVGAKLAVVSRKPQTTRNRILGLANEGETQLIFLDTPGLHHARKGSFLNLAMNRAAREAGREADRIAYLVDATRGLGTEDEKYLKALLAHQPENLIVLATKIDLLKKPDLRQAVETIQSRLTALTEALAAENELASKDAGHEAPGASSEPMRPKTTPSAASVPKVIAISAKRPDEVQALRHFLAQDLPEGPWMFASDDLTDMPNAFVCAELIREQTFRQLGDEVPYGTAVKLTAMDVKPELTVIRATLLVERDSHKGIVLGKGGSRIKQIGTEARMSLEKHLGRKVFLDLGVRVAEGWTDNERLVAELAHLGAEGIKLDDFDTPQDLT